MQDGEEAYSGTKVGNDNDWQKELSRIVFLYGEQPNTAIFTTEYADTENEDVAPDNPDNPKHSMGTGRAWGTVPKPQF